MTTSSFDSTLANLGIGRTTSSTPTIQSAAASQSLDQSDFLQLMTAQLKNQDPFSPVDNTQMVAQMAQFSSVAGISEMNTTLKAIADKLSGGSSADALGYVGRTVLTEGSTAYARTSGGIAGSIELDGDVDDVTVAIQDANGQVLRTFSMGPQSKGIASFDWDGTNEAGEPVGDGPFTISAFAQKDGAAVDSRTLVWAPVAAVSMPSGGKPILTLPGLGQVPVSAVRQVG